MAIPELKKRLIGKRRKTDKAQSGDDCALEDFDQILRFALLRVFR